MDFIKYNTKLKADGSEYKKIVFWNRFLRNPIELILSCLPAAATIVLISMGYLNTYTAVIYAAMWCYPIYIFCFQFRSSVNYHSCLPAAATIVLISMGYLNTYTAVIYAAMWCYPIYIFCFQFRSSVNYHLKHRDPAEDAPCTITLMETCIMAEIPEYNITNTYHWEDFTTIYNKFGYIINSAIT